MRSHLDQQAPLPLREGDGKGHPKPLSRLPQGGEAKTSSNKIILGNPTRLSGRKEINSIPSPLGEGQTDTPINHANQGEVPQIPLPSPPRGRSQSLLETKPCLGSPTRQSDRKETNSIPSPLGEGQTDTPINHAYQGEVPLSFPPSTPSFGFDLFALPSTYIDIAI